MELTKLFVLTVFCIIVFTTLNPTDASDLKRSGACKRKERCPRGHNCVGYDCIPVTPKPHKSASYQEFGNLETELDDSIGETADGGLKRRGACKRKDRCPPGHNCVGYDCIPVTPKPHKLFSYEELINFETDLDDSIEETADGGLKRRGACKRKERCPRGHNCVGYDCIPINKTKAPKTKKPHKLMAYEKYINLETESDDATLQANVGGLKRFETDLGDSIEETADGGLKRRGACKRKERCPRGHNCVGYDCIPINKTKAPKTKKPHKLMAYEEYINLETESDEATIQANGGEPKRREACKRKCCIDNTCVPATLRPHRLMSFQEYGNMETELNEQNDY